VRRRAGVASPLLDRSSASSGDSGWMISLHFPLLPCLFFLSFSSVAVQILSLYISLLFSSIVSAWGLVFVRLHLAIGGVLLCFSLFLLYTSGTGNLCAERERRRFCLYLLYFIYIYIFYSRSIQYSYGTIFYEPLFFALCFLFFFLVSRYGKRRKY